MKNEKDREHFGKKETQVESSDFGPITGCPYLHFNTPFQYALYMTIHDSHTIPPAKVNKPNRSKTRPHTVCTYVHVQMMNAYMHFEREKKDMTFAVRMYVIALYKGVIVVKRAFRSNAPSKE